MGEKSSVCSGMLEKKFKDLAWEVVCSLPVCTIGRFTTTILVVVALWGFSVFLFLTGIVLIVFLGVFVLFER